MCFKRVGKLAFLIKRCSVNELFGASFLFEEKEKGKGKLMKCTVYCTC